MANGLVSPDVAIAHGPNRFGECQSLKEHLEGVAQRAACFARAFGAADEAQVAGLLHDFGKLRDQCQSYLRDERDAGFDTHHAVYGAAVAWQKEWSGCAFSIAGHHAGLHDLCQLQGLIGNSRYDALSQLPVLQRRFEDTVGDIPQTVLLPPFLRQERVVQLEFYIRMLFSCLVDADCLDTEEHFTGRARPTIQLVEVCEQLLDRTMKERASKSTEGTVNKVRHAVFDKCLGNAERKPGFFSLTVPTGGGKTLASMAFALSHARAQNLDRVIVVIPYLSIIEQNAAEYRRILDPENQGVVVEHHSAVPTPERHEDQERSPMELAAENWDAPVIVTTSVQFIETLFASSPAKCRKLHNIPKSVVILDEVQTLPTRLLNPLLSIVRELKENYGVSFLFMTATQPAFSYRNPSLREGFRPGEVTEINADMATAFRALRRVNYRREGVLDWQAIAERMASFSQALCVVNVRRHAFELWESLRQAVAREERDSVFHLSSAMCAEHRLSVLGNIEDPREGSIRDCLKRGMPCRVVATQVVEAGVDLDFPVVFRALGPLDSIVQAAGRCNREGRLRDREGEPTLGEVVIFIPKEHSVPPGVYKTATEHTATFLERIAVDALVEEPAIFQDYFSQLFQLVPTDHTRSRESPIQEDRENLRFREVARKAKVIEEEGMPVVVPYGKEKALVESIRSRGTVRGRPRFDRHDLRSLQRFMVNVRTRDFQLLAQLRMVSPLLPRLELYVLEEGCYHANLGLLIQERPTEDLCGV